MWHLTPSRNEMDLVKIEELSPFPANSEEFSVLLSMMDWKKGYEEFKAVTF